LTPMVQPVSDGSSSWRGRRETHQIDSESLIKFHINEICEIYLLIKYIKSIVWRVAKCLSYIQEARLLKVNG